MTYFRILRLNILDGIGDIDDPANFQREGKLADRFFPIVSPEKGAVLVLVVLLAGKVFLSMFGSMRPGKRP